MIDLFKPVDPDNRGYTNVFECNNCHSLITTYDYPRMLDYSYCPYCGMKDDMKTECEENEKNLER